MNDFEERPEAQIKVQRPRRRLYEQPATDSEGAGRAEKWELPSEERAASTVSESLQPEAQRVVMRYAAWSAGAGLVPAPFFDMIALTALQLMMIKRLCTLYGMNFDRQRAKSAVTSLLGGLHAGLFSGSLIKLVPVVGLTSLAAIPVVSGAITYAIGRVFILHFESGGVFLDFNPSRMRSCFSEQYREGRNLAFQAAEGRKPSSGGRPRR